MSLSSPALASRRDGSDAVDLPEDVALRVDGVSKKFCKNLRRSMAYGIWDLSRNMLGIRSDTTRLRKEEFWAVKDVSFDLKRGEVLGLIGPNGSGKTTLLRLLAGIFPPDKGEIAVRGRVGALIAIGAGFHRHMTGRENLYLNGTVLGMSRREIEEKFDDIVEFAEIGEFLDAPVATYSSGMRVRLGFAVAIHINPDVLLIDEVLAVGDLAFRAKCLERMDELLRSGTTIIFVSHHLGQVSRLCRRTMLLAGGQAAFRGPTHEAVERYLHATSVGGPARAGSGKAQLLTVRALDEEGNERDAFETGETLRYRMEIEFHEHILAPILSVGVYNSAEVLCVAMRTDLSGWEVDGTPGRRVFELVVPQLGLRPESYRASVAVLAEGGLTAHAWLKPAHRFVVPGGREIGGVCELEHHWRCLSTEHGTTGKPPTTLEEG